MTPLDRLCLGLLAAGRAFAELVERDPEMPAEAKAAARAFMAEIDRPLEAPQ